MTSQTIKEPGHYRGMEVRVRPDDHHMTAENAPRWALVTWSVGARLDVADGSASYSINAADVEFRA